MKTQMSITAMLIAVSMVSCQKNLDLMPETVSNQNIQANQITLSGKPLPTAIYVNDALDAKFTYNRAGQLIKLEEANGIVKKFVYAENSRLDHIDILKPNRAERIRFIYEGTFKVPLSAKRFLVTNNVSRMVAQAGNNEPSQLAEYEQLISNIAIKYNIKGFKISETETAVDASGNSFEATYGYDRQGHLKNMVKTQLEAIQEEMTVMEFAEGENELAALSVLAFEPGVALQTGNPKVLFKAGVRIFGHENNEYKLNIFGQPIQITTRLDDDRVNVTKIVY